EPRQRGGLGGAGPEGVWGAQRPVLLARRGAWRDGAAAALRPACPAPGRAGARAGDGAHGGLAAARDEGGPALLPHHRVSLLQDTQYEILQACRASLLM